MSQKPSARRMATVTSRALAIIWGVRAMAFCLCPHFRTLGGAGRQPDSNGGPPAARVGYRGPRSTGWDVAHAGSRTTERKEKRRAEVGPKLLGAGPRLPGSRLG